MRFNQFILGLLFIIIGPTVMNAQTIKGCDGREWAGVALFKCRR
jgi:hypothetical protein